MTSSKQSTIINGKVFGMKITLFDATTKASITLKYNDWEHTYDWSFLFTSLNDRLAEIRNEIPEYIFENKTSIKYNYNLVERLLNLDDETFIFIFGEDYISITNHDGEDCYSMSIKPIKPAFEFEELFTKVARDISYDELCDLLFDIADRNYRRNKHLHFSCAVPEGMVHDFVKADDLYRYIRG